MPVNTERFKTIIRTPLVVYGERFSREDIVEFMIEFLKIEAPNIFIYHISVYWDTPDGCALFIESDAEIPDNIFGMCGEDYHKF